MIPNNKNEKRKVIHLMVTSFPNEIAKHFKHNYIKGMSSNRVYVFNNLYNQNAEGFEMFQREWQDKFIPAQDSIFRRI